MNCDEDVLAALARHLLGMVMLVKSIALEWNFVLRSEALTDKLCLFTGLYTE